MRCNSDTAIVVLHEIYGINEHMEGICERLAKENVDVFCPNFLLPGQSFRLSEEAAAYSNFKQNIGFGCAYPQIDALLPKFLMGYKYRYIVGYSIGATIAWLCSQRPNFYHGIVGFYGSRIRDYTEVSPQCPVLLFFPRKEQSFDISSLIQVLSAKAETRIVQVNAEHGFGNPWSSKYCSVVSDQTIRETIEFIQSLRNRP
ncbi:dienelactone hydrolase family protein [bacterium BFN5]|nr:dienelactone hydrolase family protein [bacterium BFN5]QJW49231.1 dienelactone hydrolase family protein [bacterium BFN5]